MSKHPPLNWITTLDELADALGSTCEQEASLRVVAEAEVGAERRRWLERGQPSGWFLSKWRQLNALDPTTYSRLTGITLAVVRNALRWSDLPTRLEPLSGRPYISMVAAYLNGFNFAEVERARHGEDVYLTKALLAAFYPRPRC